MKTPDPQAAPSPAPGPPCARHAERVSEWFCKTCQKPWCRECVNLFGGRDRGAASCKKCRERCEPILTQAPPDERPGAVNSPQERLRRYRQDYTIPAAFLAGAALAQLIAGAVYISALASPFLLILWGVAGTLVTRLVLDKSPIEFDDPRVLALKAAVISVTVHAVRFIALGLFDMQEPGGQADALALLGPLAICFVVIPVAAIACLVATLLEADTSESIFLIITLYLADAFVFMCMKVGQVPG